MLKEETSVLNIDINNWGRPCDTRRPAVCSVYRRADSMYLCAESAPRYVESARSLCQACERAPATFLCKADSASLCTACDADIHSANPLARRHHRVPILPFSDTGHESFFETIDEEDESEAASWLLFNPVKSSAMDEYMDLGDYSSTCQDNQFTYQFNDQQQQITTYDSVVPIQNEIKSQIQQNHNYRLETEYDKTKTGYGYPASSSHCVSVPSIDVGLVPESSTSDVSISHPRPPKGIIDLFSNPPIQMPTQLSPMDREARVLRYWEKKKTRKFEKTIRYASRKAYAETRPRIKGRFAKRTAVEVEVDQMFSTSVFTEGAYGIVPSY